MELIKKYFKGLTEQQLSQFAMLDALYHDWNAKINVISRKDIDNLYEHHVLHSLAIAEYINFRPGTKVMDLGTGGGFPGIPLAIMFPEVQFHLVDSTKKKILVCTEVAQALRLKNVTTRWCRAEEEKGKFDFVVSRAVMPLADLVKICRKNISKEMKNALPNGLICLKGGELTEQREPSDLSEGPSREVRRRSQLEHEVFPMKNAAEIVSISDYFTEEFFETKKVVYLPL
ncbi:MAG: 16S rRNA (guanine(527)-N(7))-methyltransferase RsmG [Bacteroidaceae bacterium]|nr:16S rRNA (guanine(527)-N(7))-methyltransferase RsmG [Bacteroidaceae bacterium]